MVNIAQEKEAQIQTKYCLRCKRFRPIDRFGKSRNQQDGLQKHCKECFKEYYASRIIRKLRREDKKKVEPLYSFDINIGLIHLLIYEIHLLLE